MIAPNENIIYQSQMCKLPFLNQPFVFLCYYTMSKKIMSKKIMSLKLNKTVFYIALPVSTI